MDPTKKSQSLPEELQTTQRLSTKKELAAKEQYPKCKVPLKPRKSAGSRPAHLELTPVFFKKNVTLSPLYDSKSKVPYLDQVFARHGYIGEGSFGKVYKVQSREDKNMYAIKKLKANICLKDRYAEIKNNEIVGFDPNCVQFFMAWEENNNTYILLEYCDMSLLDYSRLNNEISEDMLWILLYDMSKALNFLHKRNLIHLDIKPGNIMMRSGYYKLGDFGLLVDLRQDNTALKSTLSDGDSKYLAMEVLEGIYTPFCDIFGLGLTLIELASDLELPDHGPLWHRLRHDILPDEFIERVSRQLKTIVTKMIKSDYKMRPSTEQLLLFPGMKEVAKRDISTRRIDFAAGLQQNYDMPLSPISCNNGNNNNIVTTPSHKKEDCEMDDSMFLGASSSKQSHKIGLRRKSLFGTSPDKDLSSVSNSALVGLEKENISLAHSLSDSGMDVDSDYIGTPFSTDLLITSTPNLKSRQGRKLPKTRLCFE